jgi:PAS domain S-box-containing protein
METKTIKILAIDDNQDNLVTVKALINESFNNVKVFTALSGKTGLEIAALESPDVILLDILMPEMDGYEVCKTLKADSNLKEIPVVFVTALKGDKASRIRALEVGAEAFLAKPIDESELIAQVKAMVKIKEANLEKINRENILLELVAQKTKDLEDLNKKALSLIDDLSKENEARKISEQAVIESEDKYSKAFQTSPYAITITSLNEGIFIDVNESFCHTTGYLKEEIIGNSVEKINIWYNGDDRNLIIKNLIETQKIENQLGYFRKKNGEKIIGLFSAQLVEIKGVSHILASINDITEQKLAEIELNNTHQKLEVLMEAIPDLLFEVGLDGTIYNYHTNSPDLLIETPANFLEKKFIDVLPLEAANICQLAIIEANVKGISTGKQYSLQLPQGELWFDVSVAPIKNNDGGILRYVFLARDVTEQKKSLFELEKLNRIQLLNSKINDLIIKAQSKQQLFEEVCEIASTYGNFRMSWISKINEQTNEITPLVWYGFENGYLDEIRKISLLDNSFGKGPTGIAAREGKVTICKNMARRSFEKRLFVVYCIAY